MVASRLGQPLLCESDHVEGPTATTTATKMPVNQRCIGALKQVLPVLLLVPLQLKQQLVSTLLSSGSLGMHWPWRQYRQPGSIYKLLLFGASPLLTAYCRNKLINQLLLLLLLLVLVLLLPPPLLLALL